MKSYFEEKGGTYKQVGEYQIPNLVMDEQPEGEIGIWGWRRERYLKEHKDWVYYQMLIDGTLTQHRKESIIRLEEAQARDRVKERKARTHRLIQLGAIAEKAFPAIRNMELADAQRYLEQRT